ncbi:MAG: hypothetical protein ACRCWI_05675 [Brevinema sp.]
MKHFLLVLSVFLIFGACSTTSNKDTNITLPDDGNGDGDHSGGGDGDSNGGDNNGDDGFIGTCDPVLDEGLKDTLAQIESIQGFTQWMLIKSDVIGGVLIKRAIIFFLGKDTFKAVCIRSQDGKTSIPGYNIEFNNEVTVKSVSEGPFSSSEIFTVLDSFKKNVTTELKSKGYTEITTFISKKIKFWGSKKLGEAGIWENHTPNNDPDSYLMKETETELSQIYIHKIEGENNKYEINSSVDQVIKDAQNLKKK